MTNRRLHLQLLSARLSNVLPRKRTPLEGARVGRGRGSERGLTGTTFCIAAHRFGERGGIVQQAHHADPDLGLSALLRDRHAHPTGQFRFRFPLLSLSLSLSLVQTRDWLLCVAGDEGDRAGVGDAELDRGAAGAGRLPRGLPHQEDQGWTPGTYRSCTCAFCLKTLRRWTSRRNRRATAFLSSGSISREEFLRKHCAIPPRRKWFSRPSVAIRALWSHARVVVVVNIVVLVVEDHPLQDRDPPLSGPDPRLLMTWSCDHLLSWKLVSGAGTVLGATVLDA